MRNVLTIMVLVAVWFIAPAAEVARAATSSQTAAQILERVQGRWYHTLDGPMDIRVIYEVRGNRITVIQSGRGSTPVGEIFAEDLDFTGGAVLDLGDGVKRYTGFATHYLRQNGSRWPRVSLDYRENIKRHSGGRADMITVASGYSIFREPATVGLPAVSESATAPSRAAAPDPPARAQAASTPAATRSATPAAAPDVRVVTEADAQAAARLAEQRNAELAAQRSATDQLNREMASRDAATVARNRARQAEYARQQAEHRRQVAAAEAEAERIRREAAAAEAEYQRGLQAWRKSVEDCKAGKRTACANPM